MGSLSLPLVTKLCLDLATPWTVASQAPLSMGFFRQEYWSGLPFPFPGDLPDPGIKPRSPALQADSLPTDLWGKPWTMGYMCLFQFWFPQGICLGVGLLAHMVVLFLVFKGVFISSSIVAVSIYIPTNNSTRVCPFLHHLSSIFCL